MLLVVESASLARCVSPASLARAFLASATSGETRRAASPAGERFARPTEREGEERVVHLVADADGEALQRQRAIETLLW